MSLCVPCVILCVNVLKKKLKIKGRERERRKKKWSRSRDNRTFFQTPIALECPDLAVLIVDSFVFFLDQGP